MKRGLLLILLFLSLYFLKNTLNSFLFEFSGFILSTPLGKIIKTDTIFTPNRKNSETVFDLEKKINSPELEKENERLRSLLTLKNKNQNSIPAKIIGRVREEVSDQFFIDVGKNDKVNKNAAVITSSGFLGMIDRVENNYSSVLPFSDPRFNISARVSSTREIGLLIGKGRGKELIFLYLDLMTDAKPGDLIITSGEGVLPKGLLIGEINEVITHPSQLYKSAIIKPFVDVNKTEEVLVLKGNSGI